MLITFFNANPPGTKIAPGAFDNNIGKTVPLKRDDVVIGDCVIVDIQYGDEGVEVTYDTEVSLGLEIDLEVG